MVPHVPLIPGSDPGSIKAKNEQPAGVPVPVVMCANVLEVHGEAAGEAPRLIDPYKVQDPGRSVVSVATKIRIR